MPKTVDYYLFLVSPWAYLGTNRFNAVIAKNNATVNYKPMDVAQTFNKMGGLFPNKRHPSRQRFRLDEMKRWSKYLGVPINLKPAFWPADQSLAAKMVLAAGETNNAGPLVDAILAAVWHQERNIADVNTLREIASEAGLKDEDLIERAQTEEMEKKYQATTDEAHERDVFGSPTYIYKGEIFWGQDRIEFLDRALAR